MRRRVVLRVLLVVFLFLQTANLAASEQITVVRFSSAAPVSFGIWQLQKAFAEKGWQVRVTGSVISSRGFQILVGTAQTSLFRDQFGAVLKKLSSKPESFLIFKQRKNRLLIVGRDVVGAMYGVLDLADQLKFSQTAHFSFASFREKNESPFLALRGVNPFLHVQALLDTNSWYFSGAFWRDYLTRLARTRHNFLDLHAAYDLSKTNMPNVFPFFFTDSLLPEIEIPVGRGGKQVVLSRQTTVRILGQFQKIVRWAAERGIRVGLMNYNTAVRVKGHPVTGKALEAYTRRSVSRLLKACPQLWLFGFRVGESGQSEDFFRKAYLEPIRKIRPDLRVYTRTWGASPEKLRQMGRNLPGRFFVEPKYNGEQLGLPYQAITSPIEGNLPTSYSYENYCSFPQPFKIIWQVRANGTHRVFQWGDPDFVRRAVRSFTLGNAAGYTVEPMTAYYPLTDFLHGSHSPHGRFFRWMPQRNWFWYELWGRLGYNPDLPDSFFVREFVRRYGGAAGPEIFRALTAASRIVPFIFAYHRLGPDHRQMAPELEVGNDRFVIGGHSYPGTLVDFYLTPTLDPQHFQNIAEHVDAVLGIPEGTPWPEANVHAGGDSPNIAHELDFPTAKVTPEQAAQFWFGAASEALRALGRAKSAGILRNRSAFVCLSLDVQAVAYLGRYYAYKTLGAENLAFYHRTQDFARLQTARRQIQQARAQWDSLSAVTEKHYKPFSEWLRMKTNQFSWRKEGQKLERDLIDLDRAFVEVRKRRPFYGARPRIGFTPIRTAPIGKALHFPIFIYTRDHLRARLFYRFEGETTFRAMPLNPTDQRKVFEAVLPANLLKPGRMDYFFEIETFWNGNDRVAVRARRRLLNWVRFDTLGARVFVPQRAPDRVYTLIIQPQGHFPKIRAVRTDTLFSDQMKKVLRIRAQVESKYPIKWAKLYFKALPSYLPWQHTAMEKKGDFWEAVLPVDSRGALFYVEVCNRFDQAVFSPDWRHCAPYWVVPSWE